MHLDIGEQICQRDSIWIGHLIDPSLLLNRLGAMHLASRSPDGHAIGTAHLRRVTHRHRVSLSRHPTLQAPIDEVIGQRLLDVERAVRTVHTLDRAAHRLLRDRVAH